ncbi:MAG: transglycosylase SLT domain-containing protein, partial [Desulfobulbaceae bacterium]|nr:transglycosylase SLT domain-containing protein [Desulfobulbaceae bacterium]
MSTDKTRLSHIPLLAGLLALIVACVPQQQISKPTINTIPAPIVLAPPPAAARPAVVVAPPAPEKPAAITNEYLLEAEDDPELAESMEALTEETTAAEPEQTAVQEVEELATLGAWEDTVGPVEEKNTVQYDFPITKNLQVEFYLDFFANKNRDMFSRWLARSGRYLPLIQKELHDAGLPQDLAYLAMIESGFMPSAYSSACAVGVWQFMEGTGRHYGLIVNDYVDERRDPVKATAAAVSYLAKLYKDFGTWNLAVAAYNAGEGRISRALAQSGVETFWELAKLDILPLETKRYVPKLMAAIIIARNPTQYGFDNIAHQSPLAYDTVIVKRQTPLKAVALAYSGDLDQLRELNPHLRKGITPPYRPTYTVRVPVGQHAVVARNLPRVKSFVSTSYKIHRAAKRETLASISKRYGLSVATLAKANRLKKKSKVRAGTRLRIPEQNITYKLMSETELASYKSRKPVMHTVKRGETLSHIADRYNVSVAQLISWNNLKKKAAI